MKPSDILEVPPSTAQLFGRNLAAAGGSIAQWFADSLNLVHLVEFQTVLDWMNRGHHYDVFLDAMERSRNRGFEICSHVREPDIFTNTKISVDNLEPT